MLGNIPPACPPETIEGWYVLHQIFRADPTHQPLKCVASPLFEDNDRDPATTGWSAAVRLIGSTSNMMFMHFRPTLDAIGEVQRALATEPWMRTLIPTYTFLSATEAGLYQLTSELLQETKVRGGHIGDPEYIAAVRAHVESEVQSQHTRRRLYPPRPTAMPYVCFYPMSKRRVPGQNWYALPLDVRNQLMRAHGMTGRKYAGRVQQIITGAIGFDAWEWGVTLFSADPMEFKKLVTEMRFDEVSANYAEFGEFYVGKMEPLDNGAFLTHSSTMDK